jgi:aspartyl protease family protein
LSERRSNVLWVVLLVAAAVGGLAGWLISEYEESFSWSQDGPYLLYIGLLTVVLASAMLLGGRTRVWTAIKSLLAWGLLGFILVAGYVYRAELMTMWHRVAGQVDTHHEVRTAHSLTVFRARDGHFYVTAWLDGARMNLLVDTGATTTVLRPADAKKAGIYPDRLRYDVRVRTGNGDILAARTTIGRLEIGDAKFDNVSVLVSRVRSGISVLGMNALSRFRGYEVSGDRLLLKW